jgi:hypothetical protein
MIRLIAFDLDGTLLNSKKEITPETFRVLELAASKGIEIVPVTGRFWEAMPASVKSLEFVNYAVTLNGAEIFDVRESKSLGRFEMPLERARTLCHTFDDLNVIYDFVADGHGFMKRELYERLPDVMIGEWQVKIVRDLRTPVDDVYAELNTKTGVQKMQIYTKDSDLRLRLLESLPVVFPKLLFTSSVPNNIEINDPSANKGSGLRFIADRLNIPMSDTIAFGDGSNDIYMIRDAGIGVAMSNAIDEIKEAADYITLSCDEDGVAEGIKKFCGLE